MKDNSKQFGKQFYINPPNWSSPMALSYQHFEDFEKNAVSNFEEIEKTA